MRMRKAFSARRASPFRIRQRPPGIPPPRSRSSVCTATRTKPAYRDNAESTLELYAAGAAQHGIFAATYGLAVARFTEPHTQVVVIGNDDTATNLCKAARRPLSFNTAVLHLDAGKAVAQNLPPALAETIPHLPALTTGQSFAVICSDFSCQPPVFEAEALQKVLNTSPSRAA